MPNSIRELAEISARTLEGIGIAIIVLGTLVAIGAFLHSLRREEFAQAYRGLRRGLGRAILLGLEFLVGADIIATVAIEPSFRSVGVLALIIVVRTFLSFSLELEIEGRWPWQSRVPEQDRPHM